MKSSSLAARVAELTLTKKASDVVIMDLRKLSPVTDYFVLCSADGWWRVWIDDQAATDPVRLRQSSGRWAPIATAETWNGGEAACNSFSFRFERVSVPYGGGGSWRAFVTGHRFLDGGYRLRDLASAPAESGAYRRSLASETVSPYASVAASS